MEIKVHHATLSQAMLEGSKLRPQAYGWLFSDGGSCGIGAVIEAVTGECSENYARSCCLYELVVPLYKSVLNRQEISCPVCGEIQEDAGFGITHLNDRHSWSRERIATEFVAPIEEKLGFVHLVESEAVNEQVALNSEVRTAQSGVLT